MERARYVIIGAGVTGLAFANFIHDPDLLILERSDAIGGYCKTVHQDGFVWDYSGHFFHFRHPDIERYLIERMPEDEIKTVTKIAQILFRGRLIDFPFQKNIHQLPQEVFIDCLYDLYFRDREHTPTNFAQMLQARFGEGIAQAFLIPYNTKLYACELDTLDKDAMGRFFPDADIDDIIRNWRQPDNRSYNTTFTYPRGGAVQYINALHSSIDTAKVRLQSSVERIDLERKIVYLASGDPIGFEYLISSAPFNRLLEMTGIAHDPSIFTSNKVVVFNLGFDRKGWTHPHWVYVPEPEFVFYRVGFYDNIFGTDRMSLYVEIGRETGAEVDTEALLEEVLQDLEAARIVDGHRLVSSHTVTLNPAYVHIHRASQDAVSSYRELFKARGIYSAGRYGGWTYCSIEDNIIEARALARMFNTLQGHHG